MEELVQKELHDVFVEIITKSFHSIKELSKNKYLYSFAIQLREDGKSFRCVGNTLDSVNDNFMVKLTSIEDVTDYLWFTSEWEYAFDPWRETGSALQTLIKNKQSLFDKVNASFFLEILIDALRTCNSQWLFGVGILRERISVFVDAEESDELDLPEKTSQQLNPPYVHEAFLKRFEPNNPQGLTYRLINELVANC